MEESLWTFSFKTARSASEIVEDIDDGAWHTFWFLICLLALLIFIDLYHARNGNLEGNPTLSNQSHRSVGVIENKRIREIEG